MPATFSTATTLGSDHWSFYATLTVDTGDAGGGGVGVNQAPTVVSGAAAAPSVITTKTTALSVLGADDGGEPGLVYTWAATGTPPAAVSFSTNGSNAAKNTIATFAKAGAYTLKATITDAQGLAAASSVTVTVKASLSRITVTPATVSVARNRTAQFTAAAQDQFNAALTPLLAITWTVSGGGTITGTGRFTARNTTGGPFTVTAANGSVKGTAKVTVTR
jgi:hypothetical protein